jgi:hypothetical protein
MLPLVMLLLLPLLIDVTDIRSVTAKYINFFWINNPQWGLDHEFWPIEM